ncbi:CsbD family protein [Pseudomonas sp. BN417]|uniref:CsbD family protein n=1 Tax=Pseudomonas sp. BN417 TaxID=2567890 RepID=UPI0024575B9D|nr:CsbD family protein [Pseudomonas sp. BN417]MDH4559173.1 CsbD family protein [Pseudomonas sp. BN417]
MSLPSADELKGKWNQHVGTAKIAWGKLGEVELLKSEGHQQRLSGLVQERYGITRDEAEKQVKRFLEKCRF